MNDSHAPADQTEATGLQSPFTAEAGVWQRVSQKYAMIDLITNLLFVIPVAVWAVVAFVTDAPLFFKLLPIAIAALLVFSAIFSFRRVRAIGYWLREDDFLFRRGLLFERMVAVPYGRLQMVDVTAGPLQRAFGLASLKFVTASTVTAISLPGLERAVAESLRDELVRLAETRRSGL